MTYGQFKVWQWLSFNIHTNLLLCLLFQKFSRHGHRHRHTTAVAIIRKTVNLLYLKIVDTPPTCMRACRHASLCFAKDTKSTLSYRLLSFSFQFFSAKMSTDSNHHRQSNYCKAPSAATLPTLRRVFASTLALPKLSLFSPFVFHHYCSLYTVREMRAPVRRQETIATIY